MKKIFILLSLILSISAFSESRAIDLGGGYTNVQQLREHAHADVLALLGYKLENYDSAQQKAYFETRIVRAKRAVNEFIYNNQFEIKAESEPGDRVLGEAVKAYRDGDNALLLTWINNFKARHPDDVDDEVTLPDVPGDEGNDDSENNDGDTTPPPLPTTPVPDLPPSQPEVPTSDDESSDISVDVSTDSSDDEVSASSEDGAEERAKLENDKAKIERDLRSLATKTEEYEEDLEGAQKKLKKYKKKYKKKKSKKNKSKVKKYKSRIREYESKLRGLERATDKYQGKLEEVNAALAVL